MPRITATPLTTLAAMLLSVFLSLFPAAPAPAGEATYTCYCDDYCGNGGLGARAGKVMAGAQASTLESYFGLQRAGYSSATGWTCLRETASYTCDEVEFTPQAALTRYGTDAPASCKADITSGRAGGARAPATPRRTRADRG